MCVLIDTMSALRGNQYFSNQSLPISRSRIVDVVFDTEVISTLDLLLGHNLENAARGYGQVGIRPCQNEAAVLTPLNLEYVRPSGKFVGSAASVTPARYILASTL